MYCTKAMVKLTPEDAEMPIKTKYQMLWEKLVNQAVACGWSENRLSQEQAHLDWMFVYEDELGDLAAR